MLKKNARQNVEEACISLKEIKQYLSDASKSVESNKTRDRLENQLSSIEKSFHECMDIANILKHQ